MTDLTTRLRSYNRDIFNEAADEIDRLSAELAAIKAQPQVPPSFRYTDIGDWCAQMPLAEYQALLKMDKEHEWPYLVWKASRTLATPLPAVAPATASITKDANAPDMTKPCRREIIASGAAAWPRSCSRCFLSGACTSTAANPELAPKGSTE